MKPIRFSHHAHQRMRLRGAAEDEVKSTVESAVWKTVEHGRVQAEKTFDFGQISPVNQQVYRFKTVHVFFVDKDQEIVIVTVIVYYHDGEVSP